MKTLFLLTLAVIGCSLSGIVPSIKPASITKAPTPTILLIGTSVPSTLALTNPALHETYMIWRNGMLLAPSLDYNIFNPPTGVSILTFVAQLQSGDVIQIW